MKTVSLKEVLQGNTNENVHLEEQSVIDEYLNLNVSLLQAGVNVRAPEEGEKVYELAGLGHVSKQFITTGSQEIIEGALNTIGYLILAKEEYQLLWGKGTEKSPTGLGNKEGVLVYSTKGCGKSIAYTDLAMMLTKIGELYGSYAWFCHPKLKKHLLSLKDPFGNNVVRQFYDDGAHVNHNGCRINTLLTHPIHWTSGAPLYKAGEDSVTSLLLVNTSKVTVLKSKMFIAIPEQSTYEFYSTDKKAMEEEKIIYRATQPHNVILEDPRAVILHENLLYS